MLTDLDDIVKIDENQQKPPVSPSLYSETNLSDFFVLRDTDQKQQRLIRVRKTTYEDPGNPFGAGIDGGTQVVLEQKPNEGSHAFMMRSSKWFLAHDEVQNWLKESEQSSHDIMWEIAGTLTEVPPVPAIPEELKSSYVPARAGWTKMKPKLAGRVKRNVNNAGRDYPFDEKRDTAFYAAFVEIEDLYRDGSTSGKANRWKSRS